jgi:hypothetical protein
MDEVSVIDICLIDNNNFGCACDDGYVRMIDKRLTQKKDKAVYSQVLNLKHQGPVSSLIYL